MKRILHIVGGMNLGGVETWLMNILRNIDRQQFQMDFLVHTTETCAYDEEILALGSKIIPCMHPSKPIIYAKRLRNVLHQGHYDILHSHVHHYSGWTLMIGAIEKIPIRIAHSHNDTFILQKNSGLPRKFYYETMRQFITLFATDKLGASRKASKALFGDSWSQNLNHKLLFYGIDLIPFSTHRHNKALKQDFGIPADAFVIGHIGRFEQQKNHAVLLNIFAEIHTINPSVYCLLVGDGRLKEDIKDQVIRLGLEDYVIFAGLRHDVPAIMLDVIDCFLLPSLFEGLAIVLLEAQVAGIPCVYSDVIPEEVDVIPQLIHRLSLDFPIKKWAEVVLEQLNQTTAVTQTQAINAIQNSHFSINHSVRELQAIYNAQ